MPPFPSEPATTERTDGAETAVLIHGLWMHAAALLVHRHRLACAGFAVQSFSYRSHGASLAANVERLAQFIANIRTPRVHLVGHSLGGLLALSWLAMDPGSRPGRFVLMGSPCTGCRAAEWLGASALLRPLLGRSLPEWLARPLPCLPATAEIGIIAGSRRFGLGCLIPGLPTPNDGVVTLAETRLPGARDHIVLPVSHSGMLFSRRCSKETEYFLKNGRFLHA